MKKTDILTTAVIAILGVVISFVLCNYLLGDPDEEIVSFQSLSEVIDPNIEEPNKEIFNPESINPTVEIFIGNCQDIDMDGKLSDEELTECRTKNVRN